MKRIAFLLVGAMLASMSFAQSKVYMTKEISAESLVKIYEALGVKANGRVAVKISTGESSQSNHLRPELIKNLVQTVNGTLVECNTAYGGNRSSTEKHLQAIAERGFDKIAKIDIYTLIRWKILVIMLALT